MWCVDYKRTTEGLMEILSNYSENYSILEEISQDFSKLRTDSIIEVSCVIQVQDRVSKMVGTIAIFSQEIVLTSDPNYEGFPDVQIPVHWTRSTAQNKDRLTHKECACMIRQLESILENGPLNLRTGLCGNLYVKVNLEYYKSWEHYSGIPTFPVFDPAVDVEANDQYGDTDNLWKGRQREYRLHLTQHLLTCYKNYYVENFS